MDPHQTTTDKPANPLEGVRGELLSIVRSLRGRLEELDASGAWGLPDGGSDAGPRSEAAAEGAASTVASAPRAAVAATVAAAQAAGAVEASPPPLREDGARARAASEARSAAHVGARSRALEEGVEASVSSDASSAPALGSPPRVHLPQASLDRLRELAEEARACTRCALHEGRGHSVFARGGGSSGIVFVGEGPGEEEDRQGLPFVGPAGQLLDRMIAAMQLGRDDVYVCNIVKCRPPKNRKPEPDEMARCMPFLAEQLALLEPRVIIALGATAVQGLLGTTEGITRLRGQWKLWHGKVPVMPTFHPAYLLRTPQAKREVWKDLQEVLRHLGGEAPRPAPER